MKNKLIELLEKEKGYTLPIWIATQSIEIIADSLIDNGVTIQRWIPVGERLPENDYEKPWKERKHYLVCSFWGRMTVATFGYKEYLWWIDSHDCVLSEKNIGLITHWMPLPEPPKENE